MKIYAAMLHSAYEGSWPVEHYQTRENAVKCCEEQFEITKQEELDAYGPNGRCPDETMLWVLPCEWVDGELRQNKHEECDYYFVQEIEVQP